MRYDCIFEFDFYKVLIQNEPIRGHSVCTSQMANNTSVRWTEKAACIGTILFYMPSTRQFSLRGRLASPRNNSPSHNCPAVSEEQKDVLVVIDV